MLINPLLIMKSREFMMPIRKPLATIAGIMGTKMSPRSLIARMSTFCLRAAASLASAFVLAVMLPMSINSSNTLFTVPVPRMIWSCPEASNTPLTPSTFSMASLSAFVLSAMTRRSLVAQWAADTMFLLPPTLSRISCAVFL